MLTSLSWCVSQQCLQYDAPAVPSLTFMYYCFVRFGKHCGVINLVKCRQLLQATQAASNVLHIKSVILRKWILRCQMFLEVIEIVSILHFCCLIVHECNQSLWCCFFCFWSVATVWLYVQSISSSNSVIGFPWTVSCVSFSLLHMSSVHTLRITLLCVMPSILHRNATSFTSYLCHRSFRWRRSCPS